MRRAGWKHSEQAKAQMKISHAKRHVREAKEKKIADGERILMLLRKGYHLTVKGGAYEIYQCERST